MNEGLQDTGMNYLPIEERVAQLELKMSKVYPGSGLSTATGYGQRNSTGTVSHTTGFTPKAIVVFAGSSYTNGGRSSGAYAVNQFNVDSYNSSNDWYNQRTSEVIRVKDGGSYVIGTVSATDSTSFTLTFTGTFTSTCVYTWIAFG